MNDLSKTVTSNEKQPFRVGLLCVGSKWIQNEARVCEEYHKNFLSPLIEQGETKVFRGNDGNYYIQHGDESLEYLPKKVAEEIYSSTQKFISRVSACLSIDRCCPRTYKALGEGAVRLIREAYELANKNNSENQPK